MPVLHLIAGPHGAGKSTLYRYLIQPRHPDLPFVNPHSHAAAQLTHILDPATRDRVACRWADEQRQAFFVRGQSFVTETVFSNTSRVALMAQARSLGFEVVLYALALDEPRQLIQRISQRAREGGAAVPSHEVLERYPSCIENLRQAVILADLAFLMDASDAQTGGPRLVATVAARGLNLHTVFRPRWVEKVLGFAEG